MKNQIGIFATSLFILFITATGFSFPLPEGPESGKTQGKITLSESGICSGIAGHRPVGEATQFRSDAGKIWVYTRFIMEKEEASKIKHVYYFDGKKVSEVILDVHGPSFRTNSYKTINDKFVGDWKVEVVAEDGGVFETLEFTVAK